MKTVWKYTLEVSDRFVVMLPLGFEILHVGVQNVGQPVMWCLVDSEAGTVPVDFCVKGTGHAVEDGLIYVGTFSLHGGTFVGHLFTR